MAKATTTERVGIGDWRPSARKVTSTVTVPLAELVEDMDVYPRHAVDTAHVQSLAFALETGATCPPLVADKKSKRIVDGWHRARAYKRVLGANGAVDVELIAYRDEEALIIDAVQRNAAHGRKFDAIDRVRAVLMLERQGVSTVKIAVAMSIPEDRVIKMMVRVAHGNTGTVPGTKKIVLKRPVHHLQGTTLNKRQIEVHSMLPGTSFLLIARQLCRALEVDMVNLEDAKLIDQLRTLRDVLVSAALD